MFLNALHRAFSEFKWEIQKLVFEDGGDDIVAGRSAWSGNFHIIVSNIRRAYRGVHGNCSDWKTSDGPHGNF
jgi:hypothetical protein